MPWEILKQRADALTRQTCAVCLAARDPRTPWPAKALAVCVAAYAVSPVDLIPDFIPVLGYLDDLILIPAGVALVVRLIPKTVWDDSLAKASEPVINKRAGRIAGAAIVLLWLLAAAFVFRIIVGAMRRGAKP
jgi:uncharacterized membrane protein YkvA (DUF1232 family)